MKQPELAIEVVYVNKEPELGPLARHLVDRIREWYEDPENERAFQEWKKARDAEKAEKEC